MYDGYDGLTAIDVVMMELRKYVADLRGDTLTSMAESVRNQVVAKELEDWADKFICAHDAHINSILDEINQIVEINRCLKK